MTLPGMKVALLGFGYPGPPLTEWSGGGRAHNGRPPDQTESCKACRHGGLLPDCRCCGKVAFPTSIGRLWPARRSRQVRRGNANPEKSKPSDQPAPPSSRLGSALAIFSVPGPTWPRPDGGAFFVLSNDCARWIVKLDDVGLHLLQPLLSAPVQKPFADSGSSLSLHGRRRYRITC